MNVVIVICIPSQSLDTVPLSFLTRLIAALFFTDDQRVHQFDPQVVSAV